MTSSSRSPVFLLHSGGMSGRQWRRLIEALEPAHRVFAPDFIGSGENPLWPDDAPFDFVQDVELIERLVDDLGEPVHVVGHSYGGLVAVTMARRDPKRVRSVAAYEPVAFGVLYGANDEEGLADLNRVGDEPVFTDFALGGGDRWFEAFIDYWNGKGAWRAMAPSSRESFLRTGRKVFYEVMSLKEDRTPQAGYAHVKAPALFLCGQKSPAAARRVAALLGEAFAHGRSITIEGAGHMGPLTHSGPVNDAIAAHIKAAL